MEDFKKLKQDVVEMSEDKTYIKDEEKTLVHTSHPTGFSDCKVEIKSSDSSFFFYVKIYGLLGIKETWFAIKKDDLKKLESVKK